MPKTISADNEAFEKFIAIMSYPQGERQQAFSRSSNEEKAEIYKVKLAINLLNRPNLTKEQKDLILDSISIISAETYDKTNSDLVVKNKIQAQKLEQRALSIFPQNLADEIFAGLNGDKTADVEFLKKYVDILSEQMRQRKKIIKESTPSEKANFWKAQMVYHIATSNFSSKQKSFIADIIPKMTDNSFDFPSIKEQEKNNETKNMVAFISKGYDFFSKDEFYTVFMGYGVHKTILEKPSKENTESLLRWCDCNYTCFSWNYTCTSTSCAIDDGCGIIGSSDCTSYCLYTP